MDRNLILDWLAMEKFECFVENLFNMEFADNSSYVRVGPMRNKEEIVLEIIRDYSEVLRSSFELKR